MSERCLKVSVSVWKVSDRVCGCLEGVTQCLHGVWMVPIHPKKEKEEKGSVIPWDLTKIFG